jgi:hypothetical protein
METTQFGGRDGSDDGEPLVISRIDEGFRVYSVTNPSKSYLVSGSHVAPVCTCPEFQSGTLGSHCRHIEAVLDRYGRGNREAEADNYADAERLAIQNEGRIAADQGRQGGPAVMLLKRSVSPDGRIDSLSVEFSAEVHGMAANEVADRAARLLALQAAIVKGYLEIMELEIEFPKTA